MRIFRNSYYDLRGNDILKLPKADTTSYGLKSWRFTAPELWNSIPDSFITIRSFKGFKSTVKKLHLSRKIINLYFVIINLSWLNFIS